ncbi:hypothetical protein [Halobacteriovorax sp. YZS-1-1]|uniref:hypothetical protein n=1 Tax=unclassified Halobacteriovorax TaxID=2639665 RepID=UPI00399C3900
MKLIKFALAFSLCAISTQAFAEMTNIEKKLYADRSHVKTKIQMDNDNPFLNLMPSLFYVDDDHGYTHGLGAEVEISPSADNAIIKENETWKIALSSKIYTKDVTPEGQDLFPNDPQVFNEVTKLDITWDDILDAQMYDNKSYILVGAGIGKFNNSDDGGWGAIGQQRRWHVYKHNNLTPETTSMYDNQLGDTNDVFVTAKAAIGKVVKLDTNQYDCKCELDRITLETGVELVSIRKGSRVYFLLEANKVLIERGSHRFGMELSLEGNAHGDGNFGGDAYGGVYYDYKGFRIKTGFSQGYGEENEEFFEYIDDDPIWMLSIEKRF